MSTSVEKRRRRNAFAFAAIFAAFGLFQAYIGHRAQTEHTVILSRDSWYTPEAACFVAFCFLAIDPA